jgi:hypothetical protein
MNGAPLSRRIIGGDFEIERLTCGTREQLNALVRGQSGTWTTSGRGALSLILKQLQAKGVRHVHLPSYLCESLLLPIKALGLDYSFYPVDAATLAAQPDPLAGAAVLVIHYFGWLNPAINTLRRDASKTSFYLIEDAAQALLSDWDAPSEIATPDASRFLLLSPRKFAPTVLGGWCNVVAEPLMSEPAIEELATRSLAARMTRWLYLADASAPVEATIETLYLDHLKAIEKFLDEHPTSTSVPQFILGLIAGQNWEAIALRRRANWQHLNALLSARVETLQTTLPPGVVPLGYVIRLRERDRVRASLAAERIFCPVHWPLPVEVEAQRFPDAANFAATSLTLPVDQRYTESEMSRIADAVIAAL